jgi:hypothetical protein
MEAPTPLTAEQRQEAKAICDEICERLEKDDEYTDLPPAAPARAALSSTAAMSSQSRRWRKALASSSAPRRFRFGERTRVGDAERSALPTTCPHSVPSDPLDEDVVSAVHDHCRFQASKRFLLGKRARQLRSREAPDRGPQLEATSRAHAGQNTERDLLRFVCRQELRAALRCHRATAQPEHRASHTNKTGSPNPSTDRSSPRSNARTRGALRVYLSEPWRPQRR